MIKVLNLYSGIGGNRKLWKGVEVTAVEISGEIAKAYKDFYPEDEMIIGDAVEYLSKNWRKFDFIWSSPPCTTHSKMRFLASKSGAYEPMLPDLTLYSQVIFLKHFCDEQKWVVENVEPYYEPLILPTVKLGRHLLWSNFNIFPKPFKDERSHNERGYTKGKWFDLSGYKLEKRKDQVLRNCVDPRLALHVFDCAFKKSASLLEW